MTANPAADGSGRPRAVAYQADAPNAYRWTETAYDLLLAGKLSASVTRAGAISTATVSGQCPYCTDDVKFSEVLDAVTGESMTTLGWRRLEGAEADDDGYVPLTVSCRCTEPHAGRPADVNCGCGVNFRVDVQRDA